MIVFLISRTCATFLGQDKTWLYIHSVRLFVWLDFLFYFGVFLFVLIAKEELEREH